jgi:hypothetical protein
MLTGMSAAFFLPLVVSLSMAAPDPQVGPAYYRESPSPLPKQNSRLQELYLWKIVDFTYPSDAR